MSLLARFSRHPGDPQIIGSGTSSLGTWDRLASGLGYFSLALGAVEVLAPRRFTRALGLDGHETLVRANGLREIGTGVVALSTEKTTGLWGRVIGDALDVATLAAAVHPQNRQRGNAKMALAFVIGIAALDALVAAGLTARRRRPSRQPRSYRDRSGYPRGLSASRGAARSRDVAPDMRADPLAPDHRPATSTSAAAGPRL
jgi:hypothetical protein